MKKIFIFLVALSFLAVPLNGFAGSPVNVASKGFTEQVILGKIMATLLQDRGIPVKDRTSLGGTNVCREALEQGQIDVYMEYTGTAWMTFFKKKEVVRDSMGLFEKVKAVDAKNGLMWLKPAKFNNTYAIVMSAEKADQMGIKTLSDWAAWSKKNPGKMTLASNAEFYSRADGFKGMMEFYGLTFGKEIPDANVKKMETPLCKKAVRDNQVLSGMAFATDGEIKDYNQTVLTDDKNYFPIYNPAPVVRKAVLDQYPEIKFILGEIGPSLDTATMTRLNYRVNVNGEKPEAVAKSWLRGVGLIVKKKK
ncbi:MAG: glycine betaine ABC transporter substrate-binding protein [Deltaproteobacteria bacterium]|nr:glycine betaine ABC transporter substrate-binding protein [Deltaproteobacteria bacterium]MBW2238504.1 glycine betaine ABC transporter substrate-binding protein [Deltaproteobacteria bacterium]MBW2571691.1 glycine betaine ABC transporter substrate-binding protein [Deltaproteobacteria bacterium]MBW2670427.1 glycine betaine ABC transporter substrate-binding protein [Deltaproteobacteria bacterium]MBW2711938.1 glycine betaine ABC transporter substrate-binding protein [Deltaproteobacteria bacterium